MNNNYDLMEKNELNQNSKGGTETTQKQIYNGTISRELLLVEEMTGYNDLVTRRKEIISIPRYHTELRCRRFSVYYLAFNL